MLSSWFGSTVDQDVRDPDQSAHGSAFWVETCSAQEKQMAAKLRALLETEGALCESDSDEYAMLRFLQARNYKLDEAAKMYRDMAAWRKREGVDDILSTFRFPCIEQLLQLYPMFYHGVDKLGRPVYIEQLGKLDVNGVLNLTTLEDFLRFHIWGWEYLRKHRFEAASLAAGRRVYSSTTVIDLDGIGMSTHFSSTPRQFMQTVAKLDQDFYPEHLGTMILLNAPMVFSAIWAIVKPWLQERTRAKIHVFTPSQTAAGKMFGEGSTLAPEHLPAFLGGTCACPGEGGCRKADKGPWSDAKVLARMEEEGRGVRSDEVHFRY
ncbi:unnamed protein product [Pedinophyceae sp. YPF-701]|nr:unnamed protein product [Pedinophyceae sp. YPF-701]